MFTKKMRFALSGALLSSLVLSACGGSGGGGSDQPHVEDPAFFGAGVPGLHHTFIYGAISGSSLHIGALTDVGKTVRTVGDIPAASEMDKLFQASLNGGNVSTSHINQLVYWNGARLVRQDTVGQGALPAPRQVSTLTAGQVCGGGAELSAGNDMSFVRLGEDVNNANLSWKIFARPGPDAACATDDDTFVGVRMNMAATEAARDIARPVAAIHAANGALTGWLVRSGMQIVRVDANFANPVVQFSLPAADLGIGIGARAGEAYLGNVFMFSSDGKVFAATLDSAGPQAPTLVSTLAQEYLRAVFYPDAGSVLVAIGSTISPNPTRFVRYTVASKLSAPVGAFAFMPYTLTLTPSRIVGTGDNLMQAIALAGGSAATISTASAALFSVVHGGERLWRQAGSAVVSVNADGSGAQTLADAALAGCIRKPAVGNGYLALSECSEVLVVKGGALQAYRADTGALRLTYGNVVPATPPRISVFDVSYASVWSAQGAVLSQYILNADGSPVSANAYAFTTDRAGLSPITLP